MSSRFDIAPVTVTGVVGDARLSQTPRGFSTRRADLGRARLLLGGSACPRPGDLVLARVDELRHHTRLQAVNGRRHHLFAGDEIVVCYGDRYAPNQFEAVVPDDLRPCHLVAAGGVAAEAISWHRRIGRGPTRITPLGLLGDAAGEPLNIRQFALPTRPIGSHDRPPVIASLGTSMDTGKTTSAAHLVRGLSQAGLRVAFAKVTGTSACGDYFLLHDAGACQVLDFCDAGYVSTYRVDTEQVQRIVETLVQELAASQPDAIVIEVADGLLQPETARLVRSRRFRSLTDGVLFCAADALGAVAGVERLTRSGYRVLAVSGRLTAAPLAAREAREATPAPVLGLSELGDPARARGVLAQCWNRKPFAARTAARA